MFIRRTWRKHNLKGLTPLSSIVIVTVFNPFSMPSTWNIEIFWFSVLKTFLDPHFSLLLAVDLFTLAGWRYFSFFFSFLSSQSYTNLRNITRIFVIGYSYILTVEKHVSTFSTSSIQLKVWINFDQKWICCHEWDFVRSIFCRHKYLQQRIKKKKSEASVKLTLVYLFISRNQC